MSHPYQAVKLLYNMGRESLTSAWSYLSVLSLSDGSATPSGVQQTKCWLKMSDIGAKA